MGMHVSKREVGRQALQEQDWRQLTGSEGLSAEQTPSVYSIQHLTGQAFVGFEETAWETKQETSHDPERKTAKAN